MSKLTELKRNLNDKIYYSGLTIGYIVFITLLIIGVGFLLFLYISITPIVVEQSQELINTIIKAIKNMFS